VTINSFHPNLIRLFFFIANIKERKIGERGGPGEVNERRDFRDKVKRELKEG
jgi:hypothetical protein